MSDQDKALATSAVDERDVEKVSEVDHASSEASVEREHGLHRGLSARQVQMIAIAGTIGTGPFYSLALVFGMSLTTPQVSSWVATFHCSTNAPN